MIFMHSIATLNRLQFWDLLRHNGSFEKYPSTHVLAAKSPSRDDPFFNYVFAHDKSCYTATEEIIDFFEEARFHWWIQPHQTFFARHLVQLGFRLNFRIQGMQNILRSPPEPYTSPHTHIERIIHPSKRTLWINTASPVLNIPTKTLERLCPQTLGTDVTLYLGFWNGKPVSVCLAFYGVTSVGVYWLATLPEFRGFGVASGILQTILCDAYERHYQVVTLQSSPAAVMVYSRLGFQSLEQYNLYLWNGRYVNQERKRACNHS